MRLLYLSSKRSNQCISKTISKIINTILFFTATPNTSPKKRRKLTKSKKASSQNESQSALKPDVSNNQSSFEYEDIKVTKLEKIQNRKGRTVNSPVIHYCFFCGKAQHKITRHWYDIHSKMSEVKEILAFPKKPSKDDKDTIALRSKKIQLLKNKGDFRYEFM